MRTAILVIKTGAESVAELMPPAKANDEFKKLIAKPDGIDIVELWHSDRGIVKRKDFGGKVNHGAGGSFLKGQTELVESARKENESGGPAQKPKIIKAPARAHPATDEAPALTPEQERELTEFDDSIDPLQAK